MREQGAGRRARRRPIWFWPLAGLVGALLLAAAAILGPAVYGVLWLVRAEAELGPVTAETVRPTLGGVPWYPGSELEQEATRMALISNRSAVRLLGAEAPRTLLGLAVKRTGDAPEAVLEYYEREHAAGSWGAGGALERLDEHEEGASLHVEWEEERVRIDVLPHPTGSGSRIWIARDTRAGGAE